VFPWLKARSVRAGSGWLWATFFWLACLFTCSFATRAFAREVPPLEGRVNDRAGVLSPDARQQLEQKLAHYEQSSGHQFVVLTLKTLSGDVLEDFSIRVAQAWKLGKKGKDDGLLLLVVTDDRKARVEVGYGLEGNITDAFSSRVIRNLLAPAFRKGDYAGGIDQGLSALMVAASDGQVELPDSAAREPRRQPSPGGVLGAIVAFLALGPLFIGLFVALRLMNRSGRGHGFGGPAAWSSHSWSSGYGGYGGGGFGGGSRGGGFGGGGGFSGGGGSFGGGGASGSW
jgi:uncharacterized protein